ncbi:oligogalacturonate-specific porin KdgM family protein [Citrobacter youngae]|uniref:Oligogalacturonate-specific porin protein KdgM n=1 Tax=Citrobacter youngae ATCC 29220 TaxID=500640 RepID=D4BCA8_9ENTR|nr:oligogalacturonate-specific porin KdgM family protein [Citrobacter youngae]EFE08244.1 oligogalacturonate-specific porin protein KdgM [Citrobacter youngae ATCC 29220]
MKSNNINAAILMATLVMPATGVMAAENNATPVSQVKSTPFTTVYFAPRTQYRTASKGFLQRLMLTGVVQDSDSIFKSMYWSFETDADLGKNMDQWKSSYQEAEFNKPFVLGDSDFWLEPGVVFHWESAGSRIDPYIGIGYHFDPTLGAVLRYRYNHQNHDSETLQGDWDDSSEHRIDIYLTKYFTPNFWVQYNPTYYSKTHGDKFEYANGKNHTLQHNFVFNFHTTPRFYPFFELGYLDKYQDGDDTKNEYQIRVGFKYNLN